MAHKSGGGVITLSVTFDADQKVSDDVSRLTADSGLMERGLHINYHRAVGPTNLPQYCTSPFLFCSISSSSPGDQCLNQLEPQHLDRTLRLQHVWLVLLRRRRADPAADPLPRLRRPGLHLDCSRRGQCWPPFLQVREQSCKILCRYAF